jgi:DNA polymerase-4
MGLRGCDLVAANTHEQLSMFDDEKKRMKQEQIEVTVDALRHRFGHFSVQRAVLLKDVALGRINPKEDHIIHPISFFKEGKLP